MTSTIPLTDLIARRNQIISLKNFQKVEKSNRKISKKTINKNLQELLINATTKEEIEDILKQFNIT